MRRFALACPLVATVVALFACTSPPHARTDRLPLRFVWAWERPEDLSDLDPRIGIAYLAQTITLSGDRVAIAPRRQPLRVAPGATVSAVTRIESDATLATADASRVDVVANAIAATASRPRVAAVQIDFDAAASERRAYRHLLAAVRQRLPNTPLSITALASWCADDDWLRDLPIEEAVPMLFRMGAANAPYLRVAASPNRLALLCRGAVGVALDEPVHVAAVGRRVYVFSPHPWTPFALKQALGLVNE